MRSWTLIWAVFFWVGFVGCSQPQEEAATGTSGAKVLNADPDTIVVFTDGIVTATQLDQAILALPQAQRQSWTTGDPEAYRNLAQELAVDEILLREAKFLGIDQSAEFQSQIRSIRRNAVVERYLQEHLPPLAPPTEEEIQREHQRRQEEYQRAERRLVYHIFRRLGAGKSKENLRNEIRQARQEILAGQNFSVLAERISDSESRHNQGLLGWFERGELSPDLEGVIFSLEEGEPSEPIGTRDGVHLFYVDTVIQAKDFSLEETRKSLTAQVLVHNQRKAMADLEASLEIDVDVFFPTTDELRALERRGDPNAVVLKVGDFALRQGVFESMLENDRAYNPATVDNRPMRLLESVRQGELIYQQELSSGTAFDEANEKQLNVQIDRLLALHFRRQKLQNKVDEDPARLRDFFEENRRRFTSPLRLRLLRMSIPLDNDAAARMGQLERLKPELDAGRKTLEGLAAELSGELEELGWMNLGQLSQLEPKLVLFAPKVGVGEHSPPYTTVDSLVMLRVLERQEPEVLPYERVRDPVRAAYIERHGQRLYEELRQEVLAEANFQLLEEHLESWIRSGLPGASSTSSMEDLDS